MRTSHAPDPGYAGIWWNRNNSKVTITRNGNGAYKQSIDGGAFTDICPATLERLVETKEYRRASNEPSAAIKFGEGFTGDPGTLFSLEWER